MKKSVWVIALIIIAGIVGAALRVLQHIYGYDTQAGFDNPYHPNGIALIVLSVLIVAGSALFIRPEKVSTPNGGYDGYFNIDFPSGVFFCALASAGMLAYSVMVGVLYVDIYNIITAIEPFLAFVGGVTLLALMPSLSGKKSAYKLGTSFLTLWSAAYMVRHFFIFSTIPNIASYVYVIFAIISTMFAFQYLNSFALFEPKPAKALFFLLCAVYFNIVAYGSTLAISIMERNEFQKIKNVLLIHSADYLPLLILVPLFFILASQLYRGVDNTHE